MGFQWDQPEKYDLIEQDLKKLRSEVKETHTAIATRKGELESEKQAAALDEAALPRAAAAMRAVVVATVKAQHDAEAMKKASALDLAAHKAETSQSKATLAPLRQKTIALEGVCLELEQTKKRLRRQVLQADFLLKAPLGKCPCCQRRLPSSASA